MVMDLAREEEQQSALKKALEEAHKAEVIASETAEKSRMGEQRAMHELERLVVAQLELTSQLDDFKKQFELEQQETSRLRSALSLAEATIDNEQSLRMKCNTKLQHDLSTALSHQQHLLDQLAEVDKQVWHRWLTLLSRTMCNLAVSQPTAMFCSWLQVKRLHQPNQLWQFSNNASSSNSRMILSLQKQIYTIQRTSLLGIRM